MESFAQRAGRNSQILSCGNASANV